MQVWESSPVFRVEGGVCDRFGTKMIYHKPTIPRFRIAERVSLASPSNRPIYSKQNSQNSTCSFRSAASTPPCLNRYILFLFLPSLANLTEFLEFSYPKSSWIVNGSRFLVSYSQRSKVVFQKWKRSSLSIRILNFFKTFLYLPTTMPNNRFFALIYHAIKEGILEMVFSRRNLTASVFLCDLQYKTAFGKQRTFTCTHEYARSIRYPVTEAYDQWIRACGVSVLATLLRYSIFVIERKKMW